jgi:hypothetical protein
VTKRILQLAKSRVILKALIIVRGQLGTEAGARFGLP